MFSILETITEEIEESFDATFSEIDTNSENSENNDYEKGMNAATIRLLKSFCKERENVQSKNIAVQLNKYILMMGKLMFKFANAKAELARLCTYKETISSLLQDFPATAFQLAVFDKKQNKTWCNANNTLCKIILINYVTKLLSIIKQYYDSLTKIIISQESLFDMLVNPTVLVQYIGSIISNLCSELKLLFKSRPVPNVSVEFIDKFYKIYDVNIIIANLISNTDVVIF